MRSTNPAINRLSRLERTEERTASYFGIAVKSVFFVLLTLVSAVGSFALAMSLQSEGFFLFLLVGAPILALVCSLIASFVPATTPVTGSLYAIFMGAAVGLISGILDAAYSGIVFAALISTVVTFGLMTTLYATKIIRVGSFFKRFMISALLGIILAQLIIFIVSLFSPAISELFYGNNIFSILISAGMVIFAALFILIDLDRMTELVEAGVDKKHEWMASFGLLLTLIWLYMRFLQLFAKIAGRKK